MTASTTRPITSEMRLIAASAQDLSKIYGSGASEVRALDGVSIDVYAGEPP